MGNSDLRDTKTNHIKLYEDIFSNLYYRVLKNHFYNRNPYIKELICILETIPHSRKKNVI